MTTASPLEWLDATFDTRRRKAVDRDFRVGPIFTLKSAMDRQPCAGRLRTRWLKSVSACPRDYDGPPDGGAL